ncbi:unnamed protein product (macronuclear) [Paramecium tetraurelia]|uniref:Uncharacterized protein n=1 Tax=Paramecium tetraurelia TaxID=5888 RepID=A0C545_PARTE|nr:uncharacterized protein GSPATT00006411001 [Paramecium tetraurelia]CAK65912.1 unnamed protein product [Paramecium tetraurelia]|eukprot:XP_001433309.1 hypothetical protein (macronuclear) [Paramecium tetraurelia strain d4-2]
MDSRSRIKNYRHFAEPSYEQDSIKGFYQMVSIPDLIRVLPSNSITFLVYELFSKSLVQKF